MQAVWCSEDRFMATIARWSWAINARRSCATIARWISHDRAAIMSHDRVTIVSHDLTWICFCRPIAIIASRWAQICPRVSPRCAKITMSCDRPMKPRGARWRIDPVHLNSFKRTCLIDDRVDPSPHDGRFAIVSDAHGAATSPAKENFRGNIVPHGRKRRHRQAYKAGRFNAIVLPPQSYNQGPLTRGPPKCQPYSATWRHPGICVDSRGPCHVSAPPCATRAPRGPARLCHAALCVASHPCGSRVPRQLCVPRQPRGPAEINPTFCKFKNRLKIKINSRKIQKNLRNSKFHNLRNTTPF